MRWRVSILLGLACFFIHAGLIAHHTYFSASKRNTIAFVGNDGVPNARRWHNYLDLNRWDAAYYERITERGYGSDDDPRVPSGVIQWYPGYPLLARAIRALTGWRSTATFSAISATFTLIFWLLLWSPYTVDIFGRKALTVMSVLTIFGAGSFFWFAGMPESLVALLLLVVIRLWLADKRMALACVLAYATCVKQVFIPIVVAVYAIEIIRTPKKLGLVVLHSIVAMGGFIAFSVYCYVSYGSFFPFLELQISNYDKQVSLFNIINVPRYLTNVHRIGGFVATLSMLALLIVAVRMILDREVRDGVMGMLPGRGGALPVEFVLWWLAFTQTAFFVVGDSNSWHVFMSMLRYQTVNTALFLMVAWQFRHVRWKYIIAMLIPGAIFLLYYQHKYTVKYWEGIWVA